MADLQVSGRGRKLPPLSPKSVVSEQESVTDDTPRKRRRQKPKTESGNDAALEEKTSARKKKSAHSENTNPDDNQTKPRRKKKPVGSSREALMSEGEVMTDRTDAPKKKKKKKKHEERLPADGEEHINDVGLAAELNELDDDIVVATDDDQKKAVWTTAPTMRSEPVSKVFIEQQSGFKTQDKSKLARKRAEQQKQVDVQPIAPPDYNTMQVALGSHKLFKTVSVFLQGLFAGIAVWHIVAVWTLCNNGFQIFLDNYYNLALPVSSMYYFLFAVCTVAVFDRYDIGRPSKRMFRRCCTLQSGMVACLIYVAGLIFSVSITNIDDKIGMKDYDWGGDAARDAELNKWLILNLMRGLMAILGWFIVSLRPNTDKLTKNLGTDDELFFEQIGETIMGSMNDLHAVNGGV